MRKMIILTSVLALAGFAAAAQASDRSRSDDRDSTKVQREASSDWRGERHDRYERSEKSREQREAREQHDEAGERDHDSRDGHDDSDDRHDRR